MKSIGCLSLILAAFMLMPLLALRASAGSEDLVYLSDLETVSHVLIQTAGITDGINRGLQQKKMSVNGRVFEKGFCTHPVDGNTPSVITVDVSAYSSEYPLFHTVMGKDDITEAGGTGLTVVFSIEIDGKEAYMSDMVDLGDVIELYLDISGAKEIKLMCYAASTFAWLTADFGDTYVCKSGVKDIRLAKPPIKTEYREGERLSCSGGVIDIEYDNGAVVHVNVDASMISGFDPNKAGKQQLSVTYKERTFNYEVTVVGKSAPETEPETDVKTGPVTEEKTEAAAAENTETKAPDQTAAAEVPSGNGDHTWVIIVAAIATVAAVCAVTVIIKKKRG